MASIPWTEDSKEENFERKLGIGRPAQQRSPPVSHLNFVNEGHAVHSSLTASDDFIIIMSKESRACSFR